MPIDLFPRNGAGFSSVQFRGVKNERRNERQIRRAFSERAANYARRRAAEQIDEMDGRFVLIMSVRPSDAAIGFGRRRSSVGQSRQEGGGTWFVSIVDEATRSAIVNSKFT